MLKDARIKWNIVIIVQKLFSIFEYNVISLNHNNRRPRSPQTADLTEK